MPLAPGADKTCLHPGNHICILLQEWSQLLDVPEDLGFGRIRFGVWIRSFIICKTNDGFDTSIAYVGKVGVQTIEHVLGNVYLTPVVEPDVKMDECIAQKARRAAAGRTRDDMWGKEPTLGVEQGRV